MTAVLMAIGFLSSAALGAAPARCSTPPSDLTYLRTNGQSAADFLTNAAEPVPAAGWLAQHPAAVSDWLCTDQQLWGRDRGGSGNSWLQQVPQADRAGYERAIWNVYQAVLRVGALGLDARGAVDAETEGLWARQFRAYDDADPAVLNAQGMWIRLGQRLALWDRHDRRFGYAQSVALEASSRLHNAYLDDWPSLKAKLRETVEWWNLARALAPSRDDRLTCDLNVLEATNYVSDTLRDAFVLHPTRGVSVSEWGRTVTDLRVARWAVIDLGSPAGRRALQDIRLHGRDGTDWDETSAVASWLIGGLSAWYEDRYQTAVGGYPLGDIGDPHQLIAIAEGLDSKAWGGLRHTALVEQGQHASLVDSLTALSMWRVSVLAFADPGTLRPADVLVPAMRAGPSGFGPQSTYVLCEIVADAESPLESAFADHGATRDRLAGSAGCPSSANKNAP